MKMLRLLRVTLIAVIAIVTVPHGALADVTGEVDGTIVATSGNVAKIVVHLYGDRFAASATTNGAGAFRFGRVPFGHYTLHADVAGAPAIAELDVASDTANHVVLTPTSAVKEIGRTAGGTRGVRGTPVSENAILSTAIATLPRGDSLNGIVASVPGVVRFSYDEPVAHGFHGITYELDGAPLPQSTTANFSEIVDPRNVQAVEVFTGAFPAEYGGQRQGAVVNIVSRPPVIGPPQGSLTLGGGEYATAEARLQESFSVGQVGVQFSANANRTSRGLDTPTPNSALTHDNSSLSDQFLRIVAPLGAGNQLAVDLSNQFSTFQIPINTNANDPNNQDVSVPGSDDVQREYSRFASASFTHTTEDGLGFVQIVPWVRSFRLVYAGDIPNDVQATFPDPDTGLPVFQNGLQQDQRATYVGLRASYARSSDIHSYKIGFDLTRENYQNAGFIALAKNGGTVSGDVMQAGATLGAYIQDRWAIGQRFAINAGLRVDRSTGFVSGGQVSPRFEVNYSPDRATVFHAYFGRLYAAPTLEDTRQDAVVTQTASTANPPYDLKPEHDSYVELGVAHTYHPGFTLYFNAWQRNATNVLDTTQLLNTPLFAVFNNALGHAHGLEFRVQSDGARDNFYLSSTYSESLAGGVSGSTFLFAPSDVSDDTLNPEDHDQTVAVNGAYTHRFGADRSYYATLEPEFGTGYPTTFQDGTNGRLPSHVIVNATLGRLGATQRLGVQLAGENLLDKQYLVKVNNGFNTTQYAPGRRVVLRVIAPL